MQSLHIAVGQNRTGLPGLANKFHLTTHHRGRCLLKVQTLALMFCTLRWVLFESLPKVTLYDYACNNVSWDIIMPNLWQSHLSQVQIKSSLATNIFFPPRNDSNKNSIISFAGSQSHLVQVGLGQSSESERRHLIKAPRHVWFLMYSSGLTVSFKTNSLSYGNEIRFGFTPSCSLVDLDLT